MASIPSGNGNKRGFGIFRNRNFRLLWLGAAASNIGTWIQNVAVGWLVITITDSPAWLGAVALATSLPFLVVPLFGGVIADRVDRISLLKAVQTVSMVLAFILAALTLAGVVQVWHILVLSFLNSVANSFDQPTRNALLPQLVDDDELLQAVSLNSTVFQGALIGPALAGVLVGVIGVGGCFLLNALSYLFVIYALFLMRVPPTPAKKQRAVMHDLVEGLTFVRQSPVMMTVLLLTCVFSIFGRSYSTLLPAFAHLVLHSGSGALGLMYAMPGLGTLIGGFALAAYGDVHAKGNLIMITAVMTGAFVLAIAVSSNLLLLLLLLAAVGAAITVFNATVSTVLQVRAPGEMRGRVMSYNTVAWRGLTSLGGSVVGAMAEFTGTRTALAAGGGILAVAALLVFVALPYLHEANIDPVVEGLEPVTVGASEPEPARA